jgi:hypothetical protein
MSEDVSVLRELIPTYAGHADSLARRLSDQQVRAWAGEALVDVRDRLDLGASEDRFDALLMRCEFGDQHVIKALEADHFAQPGAAETVEQHDGEVVAIAQIAKTLTPDGIDAFLGELERAFDERAAAIVTSYLKR